MALVLHYFKKLFHILNDDNYPLLGPHLTLSKFIGIWHPVLDSKAKFRLLTVYITIGFFLTQYIKCCMNRNLAAFKPIIQYAPFHVAIIKTTFFIKDHEKWTELIAYISSVEREELSKGDPKIKRIIGRYIKYSHRLTYFYWIMASLSNLSIFTDLYRQVYGEKNASEEYINIFDGYTPWNRDPPGYYYIFITQTLFANMVTFYVMAWDPLVVAVMIFFANQLKVSGIYCGRAIDLNSAAKSHQNIVECHRFHTTLIRYQEAFNSLISPVMFVYLVVISVNLGVCIIEMVELQDNFGALLSYCVYVMACLVQLLLFYWHSNEVTEESALVSYNTFRSNWVTADVDLQKETVILAHAISKRLVFQAGPFNEMSLNTFVSVYCFYVMARIDKRTDGLLDEMWLPPPSLY